MVRNPIEQAKKAIGNANSAIIGAFTPSSSSPVPTVPILQPNTDIPVVPTTPADISANSKQAQFDQANPVGTAMSDVRYTPQPVASASNVPISSVGTTQAISAPPAIEKTTTTTPEGTTTVKKETPGVITPDWNVGKGREQEIMSNLETGYSKDPNIQKAIASGDYNAFKSAYGYDTSDSVKKGLLDSFFQARQPKTQESFFDSLITGLKIAKDKFVQSPEARSAQYRFDAIATYKGASVETLYNGMTNGILTPGSQAYKDLVAMNGGIETPEMAMAKQKLANKQRVDRVNTEIKAQSDTYKGVESTSAPDATQTISNKVVREKGLTWAQKYAESVSNNPELVELATTIKNDSARKKEIERVRADIYKNIIEKHPGITKGAANLLAKRESESFDEEYNNIIDTLNVNSADLRYKTSMLEKSFDYDYKEAQQAEQRAYEAERDTREFGQQKELAQFQQELGLKSDQAKFEQQMKQKAQIASDPVLATQDIIDTYAKMGILPERSSQEIIQSVQNDIAGGMTLGQSLSNLNKAFQSKDLYKAIIAEKTQQKPISVGKDSYIYDPVTGTFKSPTGAGVGAAAPTKSWTKLDDTTLYNQTTGETKVVKAGTPVTSGEISQYSTTRGGSENIQCGALVNDYWKEVTGSAAGVGDTYESKLGAIDRIGASKTPQVGGIFVSNPLNNSIGHTGIVSKVNVDGSIEVREANAQGRPEGQPPVTKTYSSSQAKEMKFSNAPNIKGQASTVSTDAKNYYNLIQKGTTSYEEVFKKLGSSKAGQLIMSELNDLISSKGGAIPALPNSPQVKQMDDSIAKLKKLVDDTDAIENISGFAQTSPFDALTGKNADTLANIKYILEGKVLNNLIDAKAQGATFGALSNDELKLLQNSSSVLSGMTRKDSDGNVIGFTGSEETVKAELKKLLDMYTEKKKLMITPSISSEPTADTTTTNTIQGKSGSYSY